ncbi:MAG: orotate phosphoribosyltransferase [Rubrobacter sp.]|nr:orotate phosphoribosyltransferase [Rubrobacter sp.]
MSVSLAARVRDAALLEGDFVLSSGKRSNVYVDKYLFSTEPELLRDLAGALARMLPQGVNRLAGVALGAVPLVVAVSLATGLPYVVVRKETKEYGTGRSVEGNLDVGDNVALIEDVVTTGTQAVEAAGRLEESGVEVLSILAVLDRREGRTEPEIGGYPFKTVLEMADLRVDSNN